MNIVTRHRYLAPSSLLTAKAAVYRRPFSISTSRALFGKIGDSLEAFNEHLREPVEKKACSTFHLRMAAIHPVIPYSPL